MHQNMYQSINKNQLQKALQSLKSEGYNIYWYFQYETIVLNIDNKSDPLEINYLKFNRFDEDRNFNQMVEYRIENILVVSYLNHYLSLAFKVAERDYETSKTKEVIKLEIDYHLMELYEYIEEKNEDKMNIVKDKLKYLTNLLYA